MKKERRKQGGVMNNFRDSMLPFRPGNELTVESFSLAQYDNTYRLAGARYVVRNNK